MVRLEMDQLQLENVGTHCVLDLCWNGKSFPRLFAILKTYSEDITTHPNILADTSLSTIAPECIKPSSDAPTFHVPYQVVRSFLAVVRFFRQISIRQAKLSGYGKVCHLNTERKCIWYGPWEVGVWTGPKTALSFTQQYPWNAKQHPAKNPVGPKLEIEQPSG